MGRKSDNKVTGAAGEHYVMYRLLKEGFVAALAPEGVKDFDILVTDPQGKKLSAIQVKTRKKKKRSTKPTKGGWLLSEKVEKQKSKNLFFCLVTLYEKEDPEVFIVPSNKVLYAVKKGYSLWEKSPGKNNQKRNKTSMRTIMGSYEKYPTLLKKYPENWLDYHKDNWGLLKSKN